MFLNNLSNAVVQIDNNLSKENLVYILKLDNLSSYEEKYVANL